MKTLTKAQLEKVEEILEDLCPGTRHSPHLHHNAKDITGQHFGGFVALVPTRKGRLGRLKWLCRCECGTYRLKPVSELGTCRKRGWGCGCSWKLPAGEAAFNNLLRSYRNRAQRKDLKFTLTRDEFHILTQLPCHYCGQLPSTARTPGGYETTGFYIHNGLDRKDSSQGYTPDNVVPCCVTCNHAKMDTSYLEFIAWLSRVALRWKGAQ